MPQLRVSVRYYAALRRLASDAPEPLTLDEGSTLRELLGKVVEHYPSLAPFTGSLLFARNNEYAPPETTLLDGDIIDIMPPVSGG